jgi:hypothetical protein
VKLRVFLSHSSGDAVAVALFHGQAAAMGVDVYLAEHDVQPGELLAEKVKNAIQGRDAVVVLLTRAGATSKYVNQEIGVALAAGVPVVPVVERGVEDLAMLEGREYIAFDPLHPEGALRDLTTILMRMGETMQQEAEKLRQEEDRVLREKQQRDNLILLGLVLALLVFGLSSGPPGGKPV